MLGGSRPWLPDLFTDDAAVASLAGFLLVWVAALQPVNGVAFVLDGLLIGAGDMRFLAWAMWIALGVFAPCAVAVLVARPRASGGCGPASACSWRTRRLTLWAAVADRPLGGHRRPALNGPPAAG